MISESDNGTDEPICRAAIKAQTWRTDREWGKEMVGGTERRVWKHTHGHG